eukprot:scpid105628/ scgid27334/ 
MQLPPHLYGLSSLPGSTYGMQRNRMIPTKYLDNILQRMMVYVSVISVPMALTSPSSGEYEKLPAPLLLFLYITAVHSTQHISIISLQVSSLRKRFFTDPSLAWPEGNRFQLLERRKRCSVQSPVLSLDIQILNNHH